MAQKVTDEASDFLLHLFNDQSLGLYRINENVRKKVPQIVETQVPYNNSIFIYEHIFLFYRQV